MCIRDRSDPVQVPLGRSEVTMDYRKESLRLHGEWQGKVEVVARAKVDLSLIHI